MNSVMAREYGFEHIHLISLQFCPRIFVIERPHCLKTCLSNFTSLVETDKTREKTRRVSSALQTDVLVRNHPCATDDSRERQSWTT